MCLRYGPQGARKLCSNLLWANEPWSASPSTPINPSAYFRLSSHCMEGPGPVAMDLVIAVNGPSFKPHEHKGGLQRVSPDEVRIAYVCAIAGVARDYA